MVNLRASSSNKGYDLGDMGLDSEKAVGFVKVRKDAGGRRRIGVNKGQDVGMQNLVFGAKVG